MESYASIIGAIVGSFPNLSHDNLVWDKQGSLTLILKPYVWIEGENSGHLPYTLPPSKYTKILPRNTMLSNKKYLIKRWGLWLKGKSYCLIDLDHPFMAPSRDKNKAAKWKKIKVG